MLGGCGRAHGRLAPKMVAKVEAETYVNGTASSWSNSYVCCGATGKDIAAARPPPAAARSRKRLRVPVGASRRVPARLDRPCVVRVCSSCVRPVVLPARLVLVVNGGGSDRYSYS